MRLYYTFYKASGITHWGVLSMCVLFHLIAELILIMTNQIRVRWVSGKVMCSMLWTHFTMVLWVPGKCIVLVSALPYWHDFTLSWTYDFENEARNVHESVMTPLKFAAWYYKWFSQAFTLVIPVLHIVCLGFSLYLYLVVVNKTCI